jgi:hypothetical protein
MLGGLEEVSVLEAGEQLIYGKGFSSLSVAEAVCPDWGLGRGSRLSCIPPLHAK